MAQITKTDIWTALIFDSGKWTDKNRDSQVQKDEIRPVLTPVQSEMFEKIDRDKNGGLSAAEILSFVSAKGIIGQDVDLDGVIKALKTEGVYKANGKSTVFFRDDKVPEAAVKDRIMGSMIAQNIKSGNAITVGFTLKDNSLLPLVSEGTGRIVMIIVPSAMLSKAEGLELERLKDVVRHEIAHAQQILEARTNEVTYFKFLMLENSAINKQMIPNIYMLINSALAEGDAYLKSLAYSLERNDVEYISKEIASLNYYIGRLNMARQKFAEIGANEFIPLLEMFREEFVPAKEISAINAKLDIMTGERPEKSKLLHIYEDLSMPELRALYGATPK